MKTISALLIFLLFTGLTFSQKPVNEQMNRKGTFFAYWGWNRSFYTNSNIHFTGKDYDFTLIDVVAKDRQSPFNMRTYFHPTSLSIPQYNFRFGYYFHDKYQISFGADHMKYVMVSEQTAKIDGHIENSGTSYDGTYENEDFFVAKDFLLFEHTDGLNYENIEVRRFDAIFSRKNFLIGLNEGFGVGVLIPRTNATLMNNLRYDEFNIAGYGFSAVASLNFTFFKYFFIQPEFKGGFIHMPNVRTTSNKADRASQYFWFSQYNVVFGGNFRFDGKKKKEKK